MTESENRLAKLPRRTQRQRREETRERILAAAHKTLIERGYAGASTWAVCETGGFSKGTLLHHFRKKSLLFQALIQARSRRSLESLDSAMENVAPDARVEVFLDWLWSTLESDFFVIGLEVVTAARTDPELQVTVRQGADDLAKLLDRWIESTLQDVDTSKKDLVRDALRGSVHMVRGIGLALSVGEDAEEHGRRFKRWRDLVVEL